MRRLADISLLNRAFIALVALTVGILGVFAMTTLRQELIPPVELPQVTVVAVSPGASSEQMHELIADPLEGSLRTLDGLEETSSTSESGVATVTVELEYGSDIARASSQVDANLRTIEDEFPEGTTTQVLSGGSSQIPAVVVSVASDLEPSVLAQRVDTIVLPEIEQVDGVSTAQVFGAPERIIEVAPDQDALTARGLTDQDIITALDEHGLTLPSTPVTQDETSYDVTIGQQIQDVEDLEQIPVLPAPGAAPATEPGQVPGAGTEPGTEADAAPGSDAGAIPDGEAGEQPGAPTGPNAPAQPAPPAEVTLLGEVAAVQLTDREATSVSRTNGQNSITLLVTPTATGNVVDISAGVESALAGLADQIGGDTSFVTVFDQAPFIEQSIEALATEGGLGLVMAVLVILVFLLSVRSTLVTALSIPLSLLAAFVGLLVFGYSLNMLTLAALTITIGRVVDDSIVVVENIKRHLAYGGDKRARIIDAVGEVAGAITASTLATVIVFLPLVVVSGLAGELFRPFAVTVALAMLASLVVALTIVAVLSYWFLRTPRTAPAPAAETPAAGTPAAGTPAAGSLAAGTLAAAGGSTAAAPAPGAGSAAGAHDLDAPERNWLTRLYAPVLHASQRHRVITLVLAVALFAGSLALVPRLQVNFLGDTGQNLASVSQTLTPGTSLEESTQTAVEAEEELAAVDGVETVQTTIGGGFGFGGGGSHEITYSITTDPEADQEALTTRIEDAIASLPESGEVDAADLGGIASSTVDVLITGPDASTRAGAHDAVLEAVEGIDGAEDVSSDLEANQPTVQITVDREAAAARGLTENEVVGTIAQQVASRAAGTVALDGVELDIYLTSAHDVETVEDIRDLEILGTPIEELADVSEVETVPSIVTRDGQQTVTVSVTPENSDDVGAVSAAVQQAVDAADLPEGAAVEMGGASEEIATSFGQLGIALVAAVLLTYLLLVWIFKSLAQPLILLVSIPFAATGAIALLLVTGTPLGVPSLIGALMLIGIVVTNAIVLVDLINQYRRRGMPLDEAIEKGSLRRLRPIVMTAAATIFALIPMALGITGHAGFIAAPLAVVTIGGLLSSTLLTLVLVPVLYRMVEGRQERRAARRE